MSLKLTAISCTSIIFIAGVVLNFTIRRSFFSESLKSIANTQRAIVNPALTYFFNVISMIWKGKGVNVAIFCYFLMTRKPRMIVLIGWLTIKLYIVSLLKLSLMDPRPFWASSQVQLLTWYCSTTLGNPSGHSSSAMVFGVIAYDVFGGRGKHSQAFILYALGLLVPLSRLYLGAHSADQVVFGLLIELSFVVLYRYKLQQIGYRVLQSLLVRRKTLMTLFVILAAIAACLLVPYVVYNIRLSGSFDKSLIQNLKIRCIKSRIKSGSQLLLETFKAFGHIGLLFGMLLSLWLMEPINYKYLYGVYSHTHGCFAGSLLRMAVEVVPAFLVSYTFKYGVNKHITSPISYFVSLFISEFLLSFITLLISGRLLFRLGIIFNRPYPNIT